MSVDSKTQTDFIMSTCEPRALGEALGSHYALQVAHQTLKERCQQLQLRLASVEEENHQLRTNKPLNSNVDETSSVVQYEQLQQKINQLTYEKAHLLQVNSMVATENKKLWNRLSRLTQANQSLGSHLIKISDTLSQHDSNGAIKPETQATCADEDSSVTKGTTSSCILNSPNSNLGTKEQSLEEISLKLINSFLQEKEELEQQYAQMVEMQRETSFNIHDLGFPCFEEDEDAEDKSLAADILQHFEKLQEMRNLLTDQQKALRSSIEHISKIKNSGVEICNRCHIDSRQNQYIGKLPEDAFEHEDLTNIYTSVRFGEPFNEEIQQQLSGIVEPPQVALQSNTSVDTASLEMDSEDLDINSPKKEDRICPMCGKFFPKRIPFDDFQKHVLHHFTDDSDPVLDNFEVIT